MLALPATLTLVQANEAVRAIEAALGQGSVEKGAFVIDATALRGFDTAAIAVLLEARRLAQAAGRTLSVAPHRGDGRTVRPVVRARAAAAHGRRFVRAIAPDGRSTASLLWVRAASSSDQRPCHSTFAVALGAQIALDFGQHRPQRGAQPQRHAGGQDVDDHQVHQARHHRAVAVVVFRVVGGEQYVLWAARSMRQRRAAGGDDDRGGAFAAGDLRGVEQVTAATRVGDDDRAIAGLQHRRAHHLHVAVADGAGRHAEAKKLVLCVLGHDARIADAIELDAPAVAAGGRQGDDGSLDGMAGGIVAVLQERADRVVDDLDHDVAGLVVRVDRAVHERNAFVDGAGQLQLEVGQAVVTDAAAKADHRGLAHLRALGQFAHRQVGKAARIGQHQFGHALLGRRQGRQRGLDAFQHRQGRCLYSSSAQAKPSRAINALDAGGPQVPTA